MGSEFVSNSGRKNVKSTENACYLPPTFACVTFVSRHVNTYASDNIQRPRVCWRGVKVFHKSLVKGEYHLENFSSLA